MNTTSTSPLTPTAHASPQPYEVVRFNALKHGILSRYTVLSHESHADYESLVNSLMDEHLPAGATEQHLIEELASVIWRKRRVLQAEGATINKGLKESARSAKTVIPAAAPFEMGLSGENTDIRDLMDLKPEDVAESHQSAKHDIDATNKASAILRKGGDRAYEKALRALLPDTREWWQNYVDDEEYTVDATGLAAFITEHVTPFVYQQEKESRHHDAIVNQTIGEGLQAYRLEKLSRYETHLDRKFERTLAMLIKLKDLRSSRTAEKHAAFPTPRKALGTQHPCGLQPVSWVFRSQYLLNLPIDFDKNRRIKMGGRGSGRRSSYSGKPETSDSMPLDIRKITRKGLLVPGSSFSWQWLVNDRQVAGISIRVDFQSMVLSYRIKSTGEVIEQRVQTQTSPCHMGGQRHWFTCPRCSKRVAVLYAPGRYFACRLCGGLGYATQKEGSGDRASSRANKLRKRLGWEAGILNGEGGKPKGMHWKTYQRLKSRHDALVQVSLHDIGRKLGFLHKLLEG